MAKIQASVLATCTPLANFWSHITKQGCTGNDQELIPANELMKAATDTLALIGNESNYIAQSRRKTFIDSISKTKPKLATFLREICKEDLGDAGSELFGPQARNKKKKKKGQTQSKTLTRPFSQWKPLFVPTDAQLSKQSLIIQAPGHQVWNRTGPKLDPIQSRPHKQRQTPDFQKQTRTDRSSGAIPLPRRRDVSNKLSKQSDEAGQVLNNKQPLDSANHSGLQIGIHPTPSIQLSHSRNILTFAAASRKIR